MEIRRLVVILVCSSIAGIGCGQGKVGDLPCPEGSSYFSRKPGNGVRVEGCTDASGAKHGPYRGRYADGKPMATGSCVHGSPDGEWIMYNAGDGSPRNRATYAGGQANGPTVAYRGSRPNLEGECKDGEPDGIWTQGSRKAVFRNGERVEGDDLEPLVCSVFDNHCAQPAGE